MATEYLTDDRRCGKCGELVDKIASEPVGEADWFGRGYLEPLAIAHTMKPCGHTYTKQALRG
jgi:hypothetical protein